MHRKSTRTIIIAIAAFSLIAIGCETTGKSTGLGAVLGGTAGAIIGHQSGHAWEGAAIGAAVGALAGYGVGKVKARRTRTAEETAIENDYKAEQGFKMVPKGATIEPPSAKPGETVVATLDYAVLGAGDTGVDVEETRILSQGDKEIGKLSQEKLNRTDGTWRSTVEFKMPNNANGGTYKIAQRASAKDQTVGQTVAFDFKTAKSDEPGKLTIVALAAH